MTRLTDADLDDLRLVGDEPADAVARALLTAYGFDQGVDETEVMGRAIRAVFTSDRSSGDAVGEWLSATPPLPGWVDADLVAAGQRFFCAWPMPIATALFCGALPSSYAAPHGAAVLVETSQLGRPGQVARRLAETGRMLFDTLSDRPPGALKPGRQGFVTVRGVRLLHAVVRQALLDSKAEPWPEEHGVPINQEDLLGTLLTFTVVVLDGLRELGVRVSPDEERGYLHAWSAIAALLGLDIGDGAGGALLPLEPADARDLGVLIRRRQHGPSVGGQRLASELLDEMCLAMPPGFDGLPAALTWKLVPDEARLLGLPPPGRFWKAAVATMGRAVGAMSATPDRPLARRLVKGPGAWVGRWVLRMCIERDERPGGPSYRIEADRLRQELDRHRQWVGAKRRDPRAAARRAVRRKRRGDTVGVGPHVGPSTRAAAEASAHWVELPIDVDDVREVASRGYPFWEPVSVMVDRNRRITLCYWDLSHQLADLLAGPEGVRDANWCTYAVWSSRTIGAYLENIETVGRDGRPVGRELPVMPGPVPGGPSVADRSRLGRLAVEVMQRSNSSGLRILAAANRAVFLDVGHAVATFVAHFSTPAAARGEADGQDGGQVDLGGEPAWRAFWTTVEAQLDACTVLDPSWVLMPSPPCDELRWAFRQYFEALRTDDQHLRSQHVLAGNLLLAAYEQARLDGYVSAALSMFSERSMRRLIRDREGTLSGMRGWWNHLYARLMTRRMVLQLPHEQLEVDQPMTAPANPSDRWGDLATDADVTHPILQALITRYQLSMGAWSGRGARDWTSFDERMHSIGMLFRTRQRQADLFCPPFDDGDREQLLGWQ